MSGNWIDFRELRQKLDFAAMLRHYNVQLKMKGKRASGFCPLPTHQGKRNSPSFSVDLERGIFHCFGCKAKGNTLDFGSRMEGFDPEKPQELRQAALRLRDIFLINGVPSRATKKLPEAQKPTSQHVLVNEPLDFELKNLDYDHPYLRERGFTEETIHHFGLGYCNRGMLKGRIAIPLHDPQGRLVGYAGRLTSDKQISEAHPKYRLPGSRERDGVTLEFRKSLLLYNAHRIEKPVDHLFVVEGFPSTWWLWQHGYHGVVALMGSDCSEDQAKLIVDLAKPDGKVWLMPDGNDPGIHCARATFERVASERFVRWVRLGKHEQPTDYAKSSLIHVIPL